MKVLVLLAVLYIAISLLLAIVRLYRRWYYEISISGIPYGDLEFYGEPPVLFDGFTLVFFPAMIIIRTWLAFARFSNCLIN